MRAASVFWAMAFCFPATCPALAAPVTFDFTGNPSPGLLLSSTSRNFAQPGAGSVTLNAFWVNGGTTTPSSPTTYSTVGTSLYQTQFGMGVCTLASGTLTPAGCAASNESSIDRGATPRQYETLVIDLTALSPNATPFQLTLDVISTAGISLYSGSSFQANFSDLTVIASIPAQAQTPLPNPTVDVLSFSMNPANKYLYLFGDQGPGAGAGGYFLQSLSVNLAVPEPVSLSLFGTGLIGAAALRRRKAARL